VSELPPGWVEVTLGEIAETRLGKMLSKKAKVGNGSRPYLRNKNVQWGRIDLDDLLEMDFTEAELDRFRVVPGDLLVCEGGEVGRAAIWRAQLDWIGYQKALHRVRPLGGVAPEFLLYLLMWLAQTNAFDPHVTGSTIRHLPQEDLRVLPVPLPPLNEQRRIVAAIEEHLSRLDAADASLAAAQARRTALRRATLAHAFADVARTVSMGEVADVVRGVTYKKDQAKSAGEDGFVPILRATNIQGRLTFDDLVYVPEHVVRSEQRLRPGDIVLAASSGSASVVGKSAVLTDAWDGSFGAFCAVLRAKDIVDAGYLAAFVSSPEIRSRWSKLAAGTNINNLKREHITGTLVPLPPLDEQRRIVQEVEERLSRIDAMRASIERAQRRSAALRAAILERAFSGELVPQDPSDEPAEALLARIRNKYGHTKGSHSAKVGD
jgi:type I restriction enzyme S subunit